MQSRRYFIFAALAFGLVGSIIIGLSLADTNSFNNVVNDPIDPAYLTDIPFGNRSDWIQPWRAYMDTVPATTLLDAVGVNFNVSDNSIEPTARLLAANGFKRARIELSWNSMDYDDPTKLSAAGQQRVQQYITAFKKYGIRPLIVLNANSGGPVPVKALTAPVTVTQPAKTGDTTIHINPSIIPQVKLNYTGSAFSDPDAAQAKYRFTNITPDGTATLSYPLRTDVPAGDYKNGFTQKFQPFFPPTKADGSPSPEFNETMNGWLEYVGAVTKAVKQSYGSDDFDVEIWNELGFGSAFLNANNYFSPLPAGYSTAVSGQQSILHGTIDYIRNPANGVPDIQIGNGFTNQSPWGSGANEPVGLTAIDKHPYYGPLFRPSQGQGGMPIDALGEKDPTAVYSCVQTNDHTKPAPFTDTATGNRHNGKIDPGETCSGLAGYFSPKEPTYNLIAPEAFLNGVTTETLIRDLAPFDNTVQGGPHGRNTKPCPTCTPPVMWLTEVNLGSNSGTSLPNPSRPGTYTYTPRTQEESDHIAAKDYLRYLVSFVNKGVKAIDFYAVTANDLSVVGKSYFSQLSAADIKHNPSFYPGDNSGGPSVDAIKSLTDIMKQGAAPLTQNRQLTLDKIADNHNHFQFDKTDDTPAHPPLYDRDVLAVLPFQVNDHRFAIPAYVMTRDIAHIYNPNAPQDGSRYDMPPEAFQITLSGFDPDKTPTVSAVDPLTNAATPVALVSQSGGTLVLQADLTDSPRVIIVDENGGGSPPPPDTTPPTTTITANPSSSTTATSASFSFNSSESGSTFGCQLDGGSFSTCTSPKTYSGLAIGPHAFSVRATDAAGNVDASPATYTWTVNSPADTTSPSAPANLHATAANATTVNLTWNAATDSGANSTGVVKYNVLRDGVVIAQPTTTSYTDVNRVANTSYSYVVQAVDAANNISANSATATIKTPTVPDTTDPGVPADLAAAAASINQVNLSWSASTDTGGSGIAGYNIYRGNTKLNSALVTTTSYGDSTASANTTYIYTIEAIDGAGNVSAKTTAVSVATPKIIRGDVTGPVAAPDGKIDLRDISYLIRKYNTSDTAGDVSGPNGSPDGKVDLYDLSYVIRNYGQ